MDSCVLPWNSRIAPHWVMLSESDPPGRKQHSLVCHNFTQIATQNLSRERKRPLSPFLEFLKNTSESLWFVTPITCEIYSMKLVSSKRTLVAKTIWQQQNSGTFLGRRQHQQRIYLVGTPGCRRRCRAQILCNASKKYYARGAQILCNRPGPSGCQGSESNSPVTKFYQVWYLPWGHISGKLK